MFPVDELILPEQLPRTFTFPEAETIFVALPFTCTFPQLDSIFSTSP